MSYLNENVLKSSGYCTVGLLTGACLGMGYLYYTKKLELEDLTQEENYLSKPVLVGGLLGLTLTMGMQYNWNELLKAESDELEKN